MPPGLRQGFLACEYRGTLPFEQPGALGEKARLPLVQNGDGSPAAQQQTRGGKTAPT